MTYNDNKEDLVSNDGASSVVSPQQTRQQLCTAGGTSTPVWGVGATTNPSTDCSGTAFPRSAASLYYPYLSTRVLAVLVDVLLLIVSAVAAREGGHKTWLSPVLSPTCNSLSANVLDIIWLVFQQRRGPPALRVFWDGPLAIGFGIAGGFMSSFTVGAQPREGSDFNSVAAGATISAGMFVLLLIHFSVAIGGAVQWRQMRKAGLMGGRNKGSRV